MPWCRRCCVLTPADLLGVTSILDCELQGCFFLLQCDDRACPDTGRHGPHTNASKFKLKRAKNVSNSVVFCWILEEPPQPTGRAIIRDIARYFNRGFDCVSMHVLVWGRSSTRRARAVGHSCALLTARVTRRTMTSHAIRSLPHASPVPRCKARLSAERCPLPLVPQATVEVDQDSLLCPLDTRCDVYLRLSSLRADVCAALCPDLSPENTPLLPT